MIPFIRPTLMAKGSPPLNAIFVGVLVPSGTTTAPPSTLNATVGDLAIAVAGGITVSSGSGGAWASVPGSSPTLVCKTLNAADIANPITFSTANALCRVLIYRGASSLLFREFGSGSNNNYPDIPGFTKSANHAGLFAQVNTSSSSMTGRPTMIDGTGRQFVSRNIYNSANQSYEWSDWRTPERTLYVDGTAFAQNYGGGSAFSVTTYIYELLT